MQLNGILSCKYISSVVAVKIYLIQIRSDSNQYFGTLCPIFIGGAYTTYEDGTGRVWGVAFKLFWLLKVAI